MKQTGCFWEKPLETKRKWWDKLKDREYLEYFREVVKHNFAEFVCKGDISQFKYKNIANQKFRASHPFIEGALQEYLLDKMFAKKSFKIVSFPKQGYE